MHKAARPSPRPGEIGPNVLHLSGFLRFSRMHSLHLQGFLAATDGAEVRHRLVQLSQLEQALYHAKCLAQRLIKKALDAQAELDCGIREPLATLAAGLSQPSYAQLSAHPANGCSRLLNMTSGTVFARCKTWYRWLRSGYASRKAKNPAID